MPNAIRKNSYIKRKRVVSNRIRFKPVLDCFKMPDGGKEGIRRLFVKKYSCGEACFFLADARFRSPGFAVWNHRFQQAAFCKTDYRTPHRLGFKRRDAEIFSPAKNKRPAPCIIGTNFFVGLPTLEPDVRAGNAFKILRTLPIFTSWLLEFETDEIRQ